MDWNKNLLNNYNPKLISDATGRFRNNLKDLEDFLSSIDIDDVDELSKIQVYYDKHQKCANALQSDLSNDKIFFNTKFADLAIEKLSEFSNDNINISKVDFDSAIEDIRWRLEELGNAQDDVIQSANQYRDYKASAGNVINNLNAYQEQFENVQSKLSEIAPLLKDDYGIFKKFAQPSKHVDAHSAASDFKVIEGQIDANILKEYICNNLGLDSKQSSVNKFTTALAEADKLLNDENIKEICDTGDTAGSEVIQRALKRHTNLITIINAHNLTASLVNSTADELKKAIKNVDKTIFQHTIWLINQGDLSVAEDFINNIRRKHLDIANKIRADRLRSLIMNPIWFSELKDFKKLGYLEPIAMWEDATKHGFKLKVNGLVDTTNIKKDFFFRSGKYYVDIDGKYFQWDSNSKKFTPTKNPYVNTPTSESAKISQKHLRALAEADRVLAEARNKKTSSATTNQGKKTDRKVHRFLDTKDVRSNLQKAGLGKIHTEQIDGKTYICVEDADYQRIYPKLTQNSFVQTSSDRKELEEQEKPVENSVVTSARQRLEEDQKFYDTISRLSSGRYSIVFYDIETTGDKPADKTTDVIQIGAVKYKVKVGSDGKLKFTYNGKFNEYIRPDHTMSQGSLRTHGITPKYLAEHGRDKNEVINEFINFVRGETYIMGFNNHKFDDIVLQRESLYFFENANSFKTLDFRELASLNYNASNLRSRGTLEKIYNVLHGTEKEESHNALEDAKMVAKSLNTLINSLKPTKTAATTTDQGGYTPRKFTIDQAWSNSEKEHLVEFDAAAHKYKVYIGSDWQDVDTSVTSYISQFVPKSYDEKQFNSKMRRASNDLKKIYDRLADAIIIKMREKDPSAEIPYFITHRSEPFKYIDDCFVYAHRYDIDTTTLTDDYAKLCARLNETKPTETDASKWGTTTHEFIQAVEYYFAISGGSSFRSFVNHITNLYKHIQDGKKTGADGRLLKAIENSERLPEESKKTLQNSEICISKINSGALDNWLAAREKMKISDSQKVKLPPNKEQENHFVAKIKVGDAEQYVGASVDLIFENYKDGRMMLIDLKATSGSNAQTYGAQVSLYKQIIEVSEPVRVGKIDANVVYLPRVSNGMVEFDGGTMSNEEFRQNKMIANVKHEFTGMEIGELSEASLDKIDPSWKANIAGMSQQEIDDSVEKFSYYNIGGMTFSGWADALGNYVKCAFVVQRRISQSPVSPDDYSTIKNALGIDSSGEFDFKHIESYLSQKDAVCRLLKKYGYDGLAENFRIAAGSVDKFIHNVLETYISNSSEGTESENAFRMYIMAGSKHGSAEQIKLREALASIIYNKYGKHIEKEQKKLKNDKAREYTGTLSDKAENILGLIRLNVNYAFIHDARFWTLTDKEKRGRYLQRLFTTLRRLTNSRFLDWNNDTILNELAEMYRSNYLDKDSDDQYDEAYMMASDFLNWLHGVDYDMGKKESESGEKAFSDFKADIKSKLKEYIKDCTSRDLVVDQLDNAAKYVARQLGELFERYCFKRRGEDGELFDIYFNDEDEAKYLEDREAREGGRKNAEMPDVFQKDIYGSKDSESRYVGKLIASAKGVARQVRYDLWKTTRASVGGMYNYLVAPPNADELTDSFWNWNAKQFGADFAELTSKYFKTNKDLGSLDDFLKYIRHLEEYVEGAFGDTSWLSYILSEQGINYKLPNVRAIYVKRLEVASRYQNALVQQMRAYQTNINSALTKLAKMVSLHTTIIRGSEMTVDQIMNDRIYGEQRVMGSDGIVGILDEISGLISEYDKLNAELNIENNDQVQRERVQKKIQKKAQEIAEKLRELLTAIFQLRDRSGRQEELINPDVIAEADGRPKSRGRTLVDGMNIEVEQPDLKVWRDINEILKTLVKTSGDGLEFNFDTNKKIEYIEHFINQFLNWQEWYGEDEGKKTSIALQLGAFSGSNGTVRITGEQVQSVFDKFYGPIMTKEKKAGEELNKYLELLVEYCNILKNQGKENDFEFKDIVNTLARNGYVLLDSTYQVKYGGADYVFQAVDMPEVIELFKDMVHLRTTLIEPLSVIQGILQRHWGVVGRGGEGPRNDKLRRNFLLYLKSFHEVFKNIFSKFKDRPVKDIEKISDKFTEMIKLINKIDDFSVPGTTFRNINRCINSIIRAAQLMIGSTMNSKEYILHSLELYMEHVQEKLHLDDASIDSWYLMEDGSFGDSESMRNGSLITFGEMKTLIRDLRNASSDALIFFSQNEFKDLETEDYVFNEQTIKSLISKGIIKYDPKEYGYFLEGVRIPREMLPADLRDSTEKPVISIERGDLMGELDINGDINAIIQKFFEGLQQFTNKMEQIASNASGESKDKGSEGTSSGDKSSKKSDTTKPSKSAQKTIDELDKYIKQLEKEKDLLKEIKRLEGERTDESVNQINKKKEELRVLRDQKDEQLKVLQGTKNSKYTIENIIKSSGEEQEKMIKEVADKTKMTKPQRKKYLEMASGVSAKQNDINRQDSPNEALARMYESEMRDIYKERMEADDKEFRYMQAMQKAKDPSVKAAYQALIDTQKKKKEEILEDEKKTHARYANKFTITRDGKELNSEDIRKSLQAEDDTNRSVKMNEILSQNPPKTYASQLEDAIKGSVRTFSLFSIVTRIMYKFMNSLRQCVNTMKELDKVQMDLRVVTGNSKEGIQELTKSYSELGFKLGLTTKEVAQSANTWLRQGYSISETNKLIEATAKLSKLGMVDAASASRYLTSAIKGFHMEASEAESVVDRLVTLDMKYAASAGDIAQALARVSAVAQSSNTSLNETTAMLTTMIDVSQQGAESVGDALKTMMSRFGNVKAGAFTKLMDSEDSENLNDIERVLNSIGITVRQSTMQMKSFSSVLDELYEKWDQLSNVEQNAIATAFAGQRQRNFFLLLMQNEESYRQALETTENAQGQAAEKYLAYMESYEYAAQQVKNAWEQVTQGVLESDIFTALTKGFAWLTKNLPYFVGLLSKFFAATSMYRAPTMFGNIATKLFTDRSERDPNAPRRWSRAGGIKDAKEYSEKNALQQIKTLLEYIYQTMRDREQRETHEKNVPSNKKTAEAGGQKSGKVPGGAKGGVQTDVSGGNAPVNAPATANGSPESGKTSGDTNGGAQVGEQPKNKTNWGWRRIFGATNDNSPNNIMAQQAAYAAILSGISTATTGSSSFDPILGLISKSYGDVKRTVGERALAGGVSLTGTAIGAYFGGTAGAVAGQGAADTINTLFKFLFHYEEVQRLDRVKAANKIVDILNSIDDSVQKATNAVSVDAAERTASDWQSIYKTRDEMQLAIYQLASDDIEKNGNGAFVFLSNFLHNKFNPSLEDAITKLNGLAGSTKYAQTVMQDFGAAYQVAKAQAEYAALESEIEESNKKLGEQKYVLGQAYLDATTAREKNEIARRYARRFSGSNVEQAAYAVQGEKAKLRLNRENQYNTLLSAGLDASGMRYWNSYQIQNSAPDVMINNILESAEKFLNDFGMTAKQNGEYTEEARKRAEAIIKKDEQLSNVYKQQTTYYGRANRGVNRIQEALNTYNDQEGAHVTMQQLKHMAKNYTATQWKYDPTASALMASLQDTLKLTEMKDVLRDIDLLADNLTGNIRKGFLLSTEAAEKFGKKLEYVTSEDALGGLDKFLEKMSDLEKLMDEITNSSGMSFESVEKVIKMYPQLLYDENGNLGTNNITGNLIGFLGGNLSDSGALVAQKAISELWSGNLGESVWSQFASQVRDKKIGKDLPQGVYEIVTNNEYTTAQSAFMAIMKDLDEDSAKTFNKLFENFIKNIDLTEEYTAIYLKTIEKMNKWRTKMNENEISELESIKNNLSSVNSERERELKLIKAREALENAKNEKKRVYRTGKIMPLDNYIGQRPEVVKTEVRRFNRNRNDCRILLVTIVLKLSPDYRQYTV